MYLGPIWVDRFWSSEWIHNMLHQIILRPPILTCLCCICAQRTNSKLWIILLLSARVGNSLFCSLLFQYCCSCHSLSKEWWSDLLMLLFTKRATWVKCSLLKEWWEQLTPVTIYKREIRAKWADCSFHFLEHKIDSLFMKEGSALFKSESLLFEEKTGHKNLYHTFWLNKREQIALFKKGTRANCSCCSFK